MFKDISTDKKTKPTQIKILILNVAVIHFSSTLNFNIDEESKAESLKTKKMCGVIKTFILTISSCFSDRNDIEMRLQIQDPAFYISKQPLHYLCNSTKSRTRRCKSTAIKFPISQMLKQKGHESLIETSLWMKHMGGLWRERS